ncbi:MAG: PLP-dependent aminotransferase family protein [Bacillota bacterium]
MRIFPPHVEQALAYDPPGSWMPPLPPGCIRLSAGYPFPESVPAAELAQATAALVAAEGDLPFHYLGSPSMNRLAELLAARCAQRGMPVGQGELLVTAGAAQALDLAARALLGPADLVAVEAPTYMEALEIFRNYTPAIVGYPVDGDGLQTDLLAADLAARRAAGRPLPRLLYTIASFQNPTGATLPPERRQQLLALAAEYDFWILEDDAYGELAYGPVPTPLRAMPGGDRVIHVGSLSKLIAPGLRVGWALARPEIIRAMGLYKKDLEAPFAMAVTARYLEGIDLEQRLAWLRAQYRARRDHLLGALRSQMPEWVSWTEPQGGFFVWLHTPGVDTAALLDRALQAGVAYVPGKYFYFGGEPRDHLRLSFSYLPPEQVERGVVFLAGVLRRSGRGFPGT